MGDPRIQERDNPLVRRLNAVAQENERLGTALGGGARPPRQPAGPTFGGSSTVLPPPAIPLTAEEALGDSLPPAEAKELERRWATDPSNPANRIAPDRAIAPATVDDAAVKNMAALETPLLDASRTRSRMVITPPDYVTALNMLPLTEEQKQTVRAWVFDGMVKIVTAETNRQLDNMRVALGLMPPPTKETKSADEGAILEKSRTTPVPNEESLSTVPADSTRKRTKKTVEVRPTRRRRKSAVQGSTGA